MMSKFSFCMFLTVNAVAGLLSVSGAALTLKSVCPGDSVQAFQNITFNRCNAVVSLNINGERNTRIATWSMHKCTLNATFLPDYKERVFLDQTGAISIRNIHHFDQGKYVVISQTDTFPMIYEVEISVMVAPTKDCKPKIVQLEKSLFATLNANDCGRPVATLYWKDNDGVSSTNQAKLKLTSGKEAGTYYACIEGPALSCARNVAPQDYCSSITIHGSNSSPISSETCNMAVLIGVYIVLGILLVLVITVTVKLIRERRRKRKARFISENINRDHTMPLMEISEQWKKHSGKLNSEEGSQLLSDDQPKGLQTYCDNLKSVKDNPRQVLETRSDSDYKTEDTGIEHHTCTDPETVRELMVLRDAPLCKICLGNKMSVFFMPCSHIATCTNCSISLKKCPVCRTEIKRQMNVSFD